MPGSVLLCASLSLSPSLPLSLSPSLPLSLSSHQVSSIVDEQRRLVDEILASTKSASRGAPSHVDEGRGELERRVLTKKLSMTGTSMFADMMIKG